MDPEVGRAYMLAGVLPSGTDRYIALFLGDPSGSGNEISIPGYARVGHQSWVTASTVGSSTRSNASDIVFATITGLGSADYWAIYDASTLGNLLRYGLITDLIGTPTPVVFGGLGDDLTLPIGALYLTLTDV